MARIPPDELERLKTEVSLQRLVEARGIELRPHGKNLIGLCPFHEDHSPSLVITPEKNLWNCLGACGTGGSVIDWVMKAEGVSFRHAVEILRTGVVPTGPGRPPKVGTVPRLPSPVSFEAEDREVLRQVVDYYHQTLKESPEALAYLEKRGLKHPELIDRFKLGYANRTLGLRLPDGNRKAGAAVRERLIRVGILRETGHEHFNGALTFPVFDEHGQVSEVYGRKIRADLRSGTAYHLYLPGPHRGVFNAPALAASPDVILCEAIIDALTFWCAGLRNVTASYGVNGFTSDHLAAFKEAGVKRVFIAYDRDAAGEKAAAGLGERLMAEGFEVFRILFPRGLDANAYAQKVTPAARSLDTVYRSAVWVGRGKGADEGAGPDDEAPAAKGKDQGRGGDGEPAEADAGPGAGAAASGGEPPCPSLQSAFPLAAPPAPAIEQDAREEAPAPRPLLSAGAGLAAGAAPAVEERAEEVILRIEDRRWRVRGLAKNMSYDLLKVNLLVSRGDAFHVDTFDLYAARARAAFQKQATDELRVKEDVIRSDLGKVLLALEELQDRQIRATLEPQEKVVPISPQEREEALALLRDPRLIDRILEDFEACGIVGEETNKLTGYLAAVSRKLEAPLAVIVQSSSAAGKTSLMEAVLAFIPEEERVKYSAMTGQSLFYMGETNLKHKILAIVEEEGAERASYALKLLQSEGELTIASTGKDPATGKLVTHEYRVEGPVMIFVTTTAIDIDEELQNRCLVLTVNESREQTQAIHRLQRERRTLAGLQARRERARILTCHRNAQRLLKPVSVINPYAPRLTFLDDRTRTRRDHDKYLNLIEAIALLHQHQRPRRTGHCAGQTFEYLEATVADIEVANRLIHEVLGRSLDELPPQTRRFLRLLEGMVVAECGRLGIGREDYHFTQRAVREATGIGATQVKLHLRRLEELEYVLAHRASRGQGFVYELVYNGEGGDGRPFLPGLLDPSKLGTHAYDSDRSGFSGARSDEKGDRSAPGRPQVGGVSGGGRTHPVPLVVGDSEENTPETPKTALKGVGGETGSYLHSDRSCIEQGAAS